MIITNGMKFRIPETVLNDITFLNSFNELVNICTTLQNENPDRFKRLKIANELANLLNCASKESNAENVIEKYKEKCKYYINVYKQVYIKKRIEKLEKDFE